MATPTVQRRTPLPASKFSLFIRMICKKYGSALGRPLAAVLLAFIVGGIIIAVTSPGSVMDRLNSAYQAYYYLVNGSYGNMQNTAYSFAKVTPLIFTGLSVAIAYRAGLFNIGAAGQLTVGSMVAGIIGLKLAFLPGYILVPLMLIGSALSGAIWGGIVGALKAWRGAHEVVTTIMLNWIAFYVAATLVEGPFQAPGLSQQTQPLAGNATLPLLSVLYNQTLGQFLPPISSPTNYTVDAGFLLALVALVVYWFITTRMTLGYELRVIGQNPKAAKYAGISVKRNLVIAMLLAGAFAGLAGAVRLMGQPPYQLISSAFSTDSTGFDAIGVALLGRTASIGILLAAMLFGGLQVAGPTMQLLISIPSDIIFIMQALVLFSIATEFLPAVRRALPRFLLRSRKPALVPNVVEVESPGSNTSPNAPPATEPSEQTGSNELQDIATTSTSQEEK